MPGGSKAASTPPPPIEELELCTLLVDHPSLIASAEADKAFCLLTDNLLRDICSAARQGQSLLELVSVQLPPSIAQHVLSGKYAEAKDPRATLVGMTRNLSLRGNVANPGRLGDALEDTRQRMMDAQRSGNRELARKLAQLAEALRKGDLELAARLKDSVTN
jgi:hypothetical protein